MPRGKATPKETVVRRVVKKIVTEEIVEEIVEVPKTTVAKAVGGKAVVKKTGVKKANSGSKKSAVGTVKGKTVVKKETPKKTPVKKTPPKKTPVKKTPVKKEPAKKTPIRKEPAKKTPVKKEPAKKTPVKKEPAKKGVAKKEPSVQKKGKTTTKKMGDNCVKGDKSLSVKPAIAKSRAKATPKKQATKAVSSGNTPTARTSAKREISLTSDLSSAAGNVTAMSQTLQTARKPNVSQLSESGGMGFSAPQPTPPMPAAKRMKRTARKSSGAQTPAEVARQRWENGTPMPSASRYKQTARKSTGARTPAEAARQAWQNGAPMPKARRTKQTARKSVSSAGPSNAATQSTAGQSSHAQDGSYVWELTHETGYFPDGFHSCMEPTKRNLGTFTTREAAVRKARNIIGSDVGYSWKEVREGGDLETVSDTDTCWELCWSPPDSEYSRVTVRRITVSAGSWVVDVEQGYPADGFHSYSEPTTKQLGPYAERATAVRIAKQQVGKVYGIMWDEVVEGGELEVLEDSSHKWEVSWTPPDSEHSHVVARMLAAPQVGEAGNDDEGSDDEGSDDEGSDDDGSRNEHSDSDDEEDPFYYGVAF